jgi:hypothetical protein
MWSWSDRDPSQGPGVAVQTGGNGPHLSVASATGSASSPCDSVGSTPRGSGSTSQSREYVRAVLDFYLRLPGTPRVTSRHDRRCAQRLFERGVPLAVVRAAMVLAVARRSFRTGDPLPQIRAVAYFGPAVEEILELPPDPGYVRYLQDKLRPLADSKTAPSAITRAV